MCDCDTLEALKTYVEGLDRRSMEEIECDRKVNDSYSKLTEFFKEADCDLGRADPRIIATVSTVFIIAILVVLLTVTYYKNRRKIIVHMYNRHPKLYGAIWPTDRVYEDKLYDAFVSFSDKDWSIVKEMVDELEKPDPVTGAQWT